MYAASMATRPKLPRPASTVRSTRAVLAALVIVALWACTGAAPGTGPGTATPGGGGEATAGPGQATTGSDQEGGAGSATRPDPCSLLTVDDLKAQLDLDFQSGVLDPISAGVGLAGSARAYCTWNPLKSDVFYTVTLVIYWSVSEFEADRPPNAKPAPGIGDDAYLVIGSGPGTNSSVSFKRGPWYLVLNMSGADWQPTETQLTEVAKLAVSRL